MIIGIATKLVFIAVLWWIYLRFRSSKRHALIFIYVFGVAAALFIVDIIASWQIKVFTLQHMVTYPSPAVWYNTTAYLAIIIGFAVVFFTRQLIDSERKQRDLMESRLTTELKYLRSQIHPHFLFNTLNNLFSIAQRDGSRELADSIEKLSGLLRYVLYESLTDHVSLEKEIGHLRDFIGLLSMRFSPEELNVDFTVTGNASDQKIAPMILLPFVENAFKHGVEAERVNDINITIVCEQTTLIFTCSNPKSHLRKLADSSGIGLENVRRRIELLYPNRHVFETNETATQYMIQLKLVL
jgi:sensor histidine kinase YesM